MSEPGENDPEAAGEPPTEPAKDEAKDAKEHTFEVAKEPEKVATAAPEPEKAPAERKKKKKDKDRKREDVDAPASAAEAAPAPVEAPLQAPVWHRVRGGIVLAVGALSTFVLMANEEQLPHGAAIGIATTLLATIGLLDMLGLLAARSRRPSELAAATGVRATALFAKDGEPIFLAPVVTVPVAIAIFAVAALAGGMPGLPLAIAAGLLPLALSAIRRPAFLVFVVASAIVLPCLGIYGLWDPWETHYGEVAREILARDDWISLWWAQEDWFWSKPIFIFWIEALSMSALGTEFQPDANPLHPEWAIRLPHYFLVVGALLAVYALVQRVFGKRAGVLAALVLATMPHFFFLAHQAITDMPFVSTMMIAMSMLGLAIVEPSDREVRLYRFGPIVLSGQHAILAGIAMTALPQILLLATRNVTLVTGGFAWHLDRFHSGSAGNAGNPGNSDWREVAPVFDGIATQPMAQALIWLLGFVLVVWMVRRERRTQSLYMFAFYFFCALSFMAKGIPGFALPGLVALLWLIAMRRWDLLLEGRLRVAIGIVIVLTVGLPWYLAMYFRHGQAFTDRLLVHDHINRLSVGVHGDTGSVEYFLEQLGYGLFPWVALVPLAIAAWIVLGRPTPKADDRVPVPEPAPEPVPDTPLAPEPSTDPATSAASALQSATDAALEAAGWRNVAIGGGILGLGVIITVVTFAAASGGAGGGRYVLFYGLMIAGIAQMLRGAIQLGAARPRAEPSPRPPPAAREGEERLGVRTSDAQREILAMIGLWGTSAFVLFSAMATKFHHYIFPAVPAFGLLVGIALDRLMGPPSDLARPTPKGVVGTLLAALAPVPIVLGVAGSWGDVRGVVPEGVESARMRDWVLSHPWYPEHVVPLVTIGIAMLAGAWWLLRPASRQPADAGPTWMPAAATAGLFAAPALVALVGRDLSWVTSARPAGYERLIHLFVYNYGRQWPEHLDYRPILTAFAIVAAVSIGLAALPVVRQLMLRAFVGVAIAFAMWCLDVYIVDLSPHWGQRELLVAYYEQRGSADEPIIAWQMNWKGENFYTGNAVLAFVDLDNRRLNEWVAQHPGRRVWFLLEHARVASLRGVLRGATVETITSERLDNKFVLVRADLPGTPPSVPARPLD
jgi:4-amino-4-deoxy-L-arabinose transferase-like glycosyltransferase